MRQSIRIVGLLLVLFQLACTTETEQAESLQTPSPIPPSLGIFDQQNTDIAPFLFDTLTGKYLLLSSQGEDLRFISKSVEEDFILDVSMPSTSLEASTFGLLLATDTTGEHPVAALQVVNGKLLFSPDMRMGNSNTLAVKADFIRLEYINQQAAAYYIVGEDIRPIAIQQMEEENALFVGLFARSTASDLSFESVELSFPDLGPALSEN